MTAPTDCDPIFHHSEIISVNEQQELMERVSESLGTIINLSSTPMLHNTYGHYKAKIDSVKIIINIQSKRCNTGSLENETQAVIKATELSFQYPKVQNVTK